MAVENLASNSMANISWLHGLQWWRNWGKRDWAISAIGFAVFVFALAFVSYSWNSDPDSNLSSTFHQITATDLVDLTLLHNATRRGAVCLDGSLPGYHFQRGFGSGANSWVLYIEVLVVRSGSGLHKNGGYETVETTRGKYEIQKSKRHKDLYWFGPCVAYIQFEDIEKFH